MYFVYFLRSEANPERTYIGYTSNLNTRLEQHNAGQIGSYTTRFRPWRVEAFILAETQEIAERAEAYFKNASGQEKFRRFAEANPDHPNPIEGFFESQDIGRVFGRSRFEVKKNRVVIMARCEE